MVKYNGTREQKEVHRSRYGKDQGPSGKHQTKEPDSSRAQD